MKFILSVFIIVTASMAQAYQGVELKAGVGYDTNVFYSAGGDTKDVYMLFLPSWKNSYDVSNRYKIAPDIELEYGKYLSETNQDYYEYRLDVKNSFKLSSRFLLDLTPQLEFASEPAYTGTSNSRDMHKRLGKNIYGLNMGFNYYGDSRNQIISQFSISNESFDHNRYKFQNNLYYNGTIYNKKYFLPETFFYWGYRGSFKSYPNRADAPEGRVKYDHTRYEPGVGVEGRLTRYFKIRSYLGYTIMKYKADTNFASPITMIEIEEELSPKDMLVMGYQTSAEDSYAGNFWVEQKLYLGYGRLLGDQLFIASKIEYSYKNLIGLEVRDDQRLVGVLSAEYSQSERLKYEWIIDYNQLDSAALNKERTDYEAPIIDSPASFNRTSTTFFVKYLF